MMVQIKPHAKALYITIYNVLIIVLLGVRLICSELMNDLKDFSEQCEDSPCCSTSPPKRAAIHHSKIQSPSQCQAQADVGCRTLRLKTPSA